MFVWNHCITGSHKKTAHNFCAVDKFQSVQKLSVQLSHD